MSTERDDFRQREEEVRHYVRLASDRNEVFTAAQQSSRFANPQHMMLQAGCGMVSEGASTPSDLRSWCLTIACILAHLGRRDATILTRRILARKKSAEASYEQIGATLGMSRSDVETRYKKAVEYVYREIVDRGIVESYRPEPEDVIPTSTIPTPTIKNFQCSASVLAYT